MAIVGVILKYKLTLYLFGNGSFQSNTFDMPVQDSMKGVITSMKKALTTAGAVPIQRKISAQSYMKRNWMLYLMALPGLLCLLIFKYVPMYGVLMAFENYYPAKGILGSDWVGFKHFVTFFKSPYFERLIGNTFALGIASLIFSFPAPIILALLFNELHNERFKRITQTISYMPYFISTVIVIGLLKDMCSTNDGIINQLIVALGGERIAFFASPQWFRRFIFFPASGPVSATTPLFIWPLSQESIQNSMSRLCWTGHPGLNRLSTLPSRVSLPRS